jgi:hypothetical protein
LNHPGLLGPASGEAGQRAKQDSGQFSNHQSKTPFSKNSTRKKLIHFQPYIFFHLSVYSLEKGQRPLNFNT